MFDELDIIELTHDIRESNLKKGDTGTIVFIYESNSARSKAYEVEFLASNGDTIALLTLMPEDIRLVDTQDKHVAHHPSV